MKNNKHLVFTFPAKDGFLGLILNYVLYGFGFEISSTGYHHYQGYVELRKE